MKRDLPKRTISKKRDRQKETDIHEKKGIVTAKVEPFNRHP